MQKNEEGMVLALFIELQVEINEETFWLLAAEN
jgi:hypothetical protein